MYAPAGPAEQEAGSSNLLQANDLLACLEMEMEHQLEGHLLALQHQPQDQTQTGQLGASLAAPKVCRNSQNRRKTVSSSRQLAGCKVGRPEVAQQGVEWSRRLQFAAWPLGSSETGTLFQAEDQDEDEDEDEDEVEKEQSK